MLYEVFLMNQNYTCGAFNTLDKAIKKARKTGFQCMIFRSDNPFKPIKYVCPVGGTK